MRTHEGWKQAQPVDKYYKAMEKCGVNWVKAQRKLKRIETDMAAYGDWHLYQDEDGNYWEDYFSIGD